MRIVKSFVLVLLIFMILSCATTPLRTASGRPEVSINGVTREDVSNALINEMVNAGFTLYQADEYKLCFKKKEKNILVNVFFGSRFNPITEFRIIFNLIEFPNYVRVIATSALIVTNPGSAFERENEVMGGKVASQLQEILEKIKQKLEEKSMK